MLRKVPAVVLLLLASCSSGEYQQIETAALVDDESRRPVPSHGQRDIDATYALVALGPHFSHVRTVLDAGARLSSENCSTSEIRDLVSSSACAEAIEVARSHRADRFLVLEAGAALGGGLQGVLVFESNRDDLYYVWIYEEPDETYEIRSFHPMKKGPGAAVRYLELFETAFDSSKYWQ